VCKNKILGVLEGGAKTLRRSMVSGSTEMFSNSSAFATALEAEAQLLLRPQAGLGVLEGGGFT
jgi:hypothetical protein